MKKLVILFIALSVVLACSKHDNGEMEAQAHEADSLALHIAVMPVLSSLPVYYAERTGLAQQEGLDIRLMRYTAQMDIDTAVLRNRADIYLTDVIRSVRLNEKQPLRILMQVKEPLTLLVQKNLRITRTSQLRERTVAMARLSVTDAWLESIIDSTALTFYDVFRAQINDVKLRSEMLRTGLMDAAILTEPYATWALNAGSRKLSQTKDGLYANAVWVVTDSLRNDKRKQQQIELFATIYNRAVDAMNAGEKTDTVRAILIQDFAIPKEVADTLRLPLLQPWEAPDSARQLRQALDWLHGRNALPAEYNTLPRAK
ncbi:MAG: ABC transporter substrate-binding protein [Bacteroidaceae bacterium]|nr:ABC transporter substrate-binding protein [Bacteroidaceae bacterium]